MTEQPNVPAPDRNPDPDSVVVVTDLRAFAMDSALTDVQYALGQIDRVLRRFGPVCELVRARDGLLRAVENLTQTATVPTQDFGDSLEAGMPPPKKPEEWTAQEIMDNDG